MSEWDEVRFRQLPLHRPRSSIGTRPMFWLCLSLAAVLYFLVGEIVFG